MYVPAIDELMVKNCLDKIVTNFPIVKDYLPDYTNDTQVEREFLWGVFSTKCYLPCKRFVENAIKRKAFQEHQEKKSFVRIKPSIMKVLESSSYFSKAKGRTHHLLKDKTEGASQMRDNLLG